MLLLILNSFIIPAATIHASSPDLDVIGVVRSYSNPIVGDSVRFDVSVKNQGDGTAATSQTRLRLDFSNDGSFETTLYQGLASVSAGDSRVASFLWTADAPGAYTIESCADVGNMVVESNEGNNCFTQTFSVGGSGGGSDVPPAPRLSQGQADLNISGVVRSHFTPTVGDAVRFDVYVKNSGNGAAAPSQTRLRLDFNSDRSFETMLNQYAYLILPNETKIVSFTWTAGAPGAYTVESCADIGNIVAESNESNNCATQTFSVRSAAGPVVQPPVVQPPVVVQPPAQPPVYIQPPAQPPQTIYLTPTQAAPIYVQSPVPSITYVQPPAAAAPIVYTQYDIGQFPDLSVEDMYTSPSALLLNQTVTIRASIKNNSGFVRADASYARLRVDDSRVSDVDFTERYYVDYIMPMDYRVASFYWTPRTTGSHKIEICADSDNNIIESNESNNCSIFYVSVGGEITSNYPTISFYSVPTSVSRGNSALLVWSVSNASSCYASNGWSGAKGTSGTETIYPSATKTYTLTCSNSYGQSVKSINIEVTGAVPAIVQNLVASCVASPPAAVIGQTVIFAAGQSGAIGTPSYSWSGDLSGSGISREVSFNSVGTKTAVMTVTDSAGRAATAQCQTTITAVAKKVYKPKAVAKPRVAPCPVGCVPVCPTGCVAPCPGADARSGGSYPCVGVGNGVSNGGSANVYGGTNNNVYQPQQPSSNVVDTNIVQEGKTTALVLDLGISGIGRFFLWFSLILLNLFLIGALIYMFKQFLAYRQQQGGGLPR